MIIAIHASGRKDSNSSILLDASLEKYPSQQVEHVRLASLTFKGCIGCGACRSWADGCVLKDDLPPVLEMIKKADALVCAAPNYYGYVSGIFKSFLDRFYGFRDGERNLRLPEGRKLLFITSQGHPDKAAYEAMIKSMERIFSGYGFVPTTLVAAGVQAPGQARESAELMGTAARLGEELTGDR